MALQGTLDTFSLPDVLRLLATTGKTGCLHLDGDRGHGSVWLDDGTLVAAAADRATEGASIDEVIFEMLRFDRGSFSFAVDERSPRGEQPTELEAALRRAGQLLDEWRGLEAVVPSLDHKVAMAPELTVDQVTIDAGRWQALVAIAGGRPVGELGEVLGQGELGVTRTVSDLVELGVAVVQPPEPARTSSAGRRNVTDIGSRRAEETPRRNPRREAASGTEGMSRAVNWARSGDNGGGSAVPSPADAERGDHVGRARYRDAGGDEGQRSATSLPGRASGASPAAGPGGVPNGTPPGGRPAVGAGSATPPNGNAKADVVPPTRTRGGSGGGRTGRSRARSSSPGKGHTVPLPTGPTRNGQPLPTGPTSPGLMAGPGLATAPDLTTDDTGPGPLARRNGTPPAGLRVPGPLQSGSLPVPDPARGPLLPPTLDTGRLGPSPLSTDTGQIPAVAASSLPPDLGWAAEDDELPIAPPMAANQGGPPPAAMMAPPAPSSAPVPGALKLPSRLVTTPPSGRAPVPPPPPPPAAQQGDPAPHVVAMSPEARAAVEMTVGRAGGGQGGGLQMAGATQEQIMGRGHLLQFLSSVRG